MNSRFLFVVGDQGDDVHQPLIRSLVLAQALADNGGACTIVATPDVLGNLHALAPSMTRAAAASDRCEDIAQTVARLEFDAIVFDHPSLSQEDHIALSGDRPSVVIDDAADRPIGGQIVVNPALTARPVDYEGLCLAGATILTGPQFSPVVSDYAKLRSQGPKQCGPLRRVLLALGDRAPEALVTQVIDQLRPRLGDAALDVLLPQEFNTLRGLSRVANRDPRLALHTLPLEYPLIAARSDLAITGTGASLWEACTLGLPIISLSRRASDGAVAQRLAELDAAICLDFQDPAFDVRLERAFVRLGSDPTLRGKLSAKAATLTDGSGSQQVAQKLIGLLLR